jgi:hypothetical protein
MYEICGTATTRNAKIRKLGRAEDHRRPRYGLERTRRNPARGRHMQMSSSPSSVIIAPVQRVWYPVQTGVLKWNRPPDAPGAQVLSSRFIIVTGRRGRSSEKLEQTNKRTDTHRIGWPYLWKKKKRNGTNMFSIENNNNVFCFIHTK